MRRHKPIRSLHLRLIVALLALGIVAGALPAAPAPSGQEPTFLGFSPGEERRYVLGPPEMLYSGEQALWTIQLREVLGDPGDGIFELSYVWDRGQPTRNQLAIGTISRVQTFGELRVNPYGFPVEATFETERHLAGLGGETYRVIYRLEDDHFTKRIMVGGRDLEHRARNVSNDALDFDVPVGMYVFGVAAFDCMLTLPPETSDDSAYMGSPGAGSGMSPAVPSGMRFAGAQDCKEPLFANPGLLSLVLPALWEAGTGELEFVALTPAGFHGMPGLGGTAVQPGMSAAMMNRHFDSQAASHPRTNSDIEKLTYKDRVRVEVGTRERDAWLFDGMRDFEAVYVDDDGVVLRVDLAANAAMRMQTAQQAMYEGQPMMVDIRELHIRMLWPSEY